MKTISIIIFASFILVMHGCTISSECFGISLFECGGNECLCSEDSHCVSEEKSKCDENNKCVECKTNSECQHLPNFKYCYYGHCKQCDAANENNDCTSIYEPICISSTKMCRYCDSDLDCSHISLNGIIRPYCVNDICAECASSTDCKSISKSRCFSYQCCLCESDSDCSQFLATPYCGVYGCEVCISNSHCQTISTTTTPKCKYYKCSPCEINTDCPDYLKYSSTITLKKYCVDNLCRECTSNLHCENYLLPRCNLETYACESCLSNEDCSLFTDRKYCISSKCLKCLSDDTNCLECASSCDTCSSNNPNICLTCFPNQYLDIDNLCKPACNNPNALITIEKNYYVCKDCHENCLTCTGSSSNQCLTCPPNLILTPSGTCAGCSSNCVNCLDSTDFCTSCLPDFYLENNKCLENCEKGYFVQGTNCIKCHSSCLECTGPTSAQCTACRCFDTFSNGKCVSNAVIDTCSFSDSSSCLFSDDTFCSNSYGAYCASGETLTPNGICSSECGSRFYPTLRTVSDFSYYICLKCDTSCKTCNYAGPNSCTSCKKGNFLNNGQCSKCHEYCDECSGGSNTECISCKKDKYFFKNSCLTACPTSYYGNLIPIQSMASYYNCVACHSDCLTCSNPNKNGCTSCRCCETLVKNSETLATTGECHRCYKSCLSCVGNSPATCSCRSGQFLNSEGRCVSECELYYYPIIISRNGIDFGKCEECSNNCKACSSYSICTSCREGYYLNTDSSCKLSCSERTFPVPYFDYFRCHECDESCDLCFDVGPYSCTSCKPKYFLDSRGYCLPCIDNCYECESIETMCKSCEIPYKLYNNQCFIECPDELYEFNYRCIDCEESCVQCTNELTCKMCIDKYYLSNGDCLQCKPECNSCLSETECISCQKNYFLSDGVCEKCDPQCAECLTTATYCINICDQSKQFSDTSDTKFCKDFNSFDGDGCSSECHIESGYMCIGTPLIDQSDFCFLTDLLQEGYYDIEYELGPRNTYIKIIFLEGLLLDSVSELITVESSDSDDDFEYSVLDHTNNVYRISITSKKQTKYIILNFGNTPEEKLCFLSKKYHKLNETEHKIFLNKNEEEEEEGEEEGKEEGEEEGEDPSAIDSEIDVYLWIRIALLIIFSLLLVLSISLNSMQVFFTEIGFFLKLSYLSVLSLSSDHLQKFFTIFNFSRFTYSKFFNPKRVLFEKENEYDRLFFVKNAIQYLVLLAIIVLVGFIRDICVKRNNRGENGNNVNKCQLLLSRILVVFNLCFTDLMILSIYQISLRDTEDNLTNVIIAIILICICSIYKLIIPILIIIGIKRRINWIEKILIRQSYMELNFKKKEKIAIIFPLADFMHFILIGIILFAIKNSPREQGIYCCLITFALLFLFFILFPFKHDFYNIVYVGNLLLYMILFILIIVLESINQNSQEKFGIGIIVTISILLLILLFGKLYLMFLFNHWNRSRKNYDEIQEMEEIEKQQREKFQFLSYIYHVMKQYTQAIVKKQ